MECLNHEFKTQPLWTAGIIVNGDYSPETWNKDTSSVEVTVIWTIHHSLGDGLSMVSRGSLINSGRWREHI